MGIYICHQRLILSPASSVEKPLNCPRPAATTSSPQATALAMRPVAQPYSMSVEDARTQSALQGENEENGAIRGPMSNNIGDEIRSQPSKKNKRSRYHKTENF